MKDPQIEELRDLNLLDSSIQARIGSMFEREYPKGTDWLLGVEVDDMLDVYVTIVSEPARDSKVRKLLRANFPEYEFDYGGGVGGGGWRVLSGETPKNL